MAHTVSVPSPAAVDAPARTAAGSAAIPWYVWCLVLATTCSVVGGVWDISWHKSIGRDTFWTPAHILIYLCGVLAGVGAGWLILGATFGSSASLRRASVRLWGFRGPLGAFLCAWGGVAMLASAPFDNWWHSAYGLDVKVLSPPHVVLIFGVLGVRFGALLVVLGEMNRAEGKLRARLRWLLLYLGTIMLGGTLGAFLELTSRNLLHSARFYLIVALVAPLILVAVTRAAGGAWSGTLLGTAFTLLAALFIWILPLFPAEPKLGPVYQNVTHFIPHDFPLLIVVPAFFLDLLRRRAASWSCWRYALAAGPIFLASFAAVQWPFADFLMSPAARNWFFGTHYFPFFIPSTHDYVRHVFTTVEPTAAIFSMVMTAAVAAAVVSTRLGLAWGDWMRRIRR